MVKINFKSKKLLALFTFSLLILGGSILKIGGSQSKNRDVAPYTIKVQEGKLPGFITSSGELLAVKSVNVSPKRRGILNEIYVNEGNKIKKGELIARMDPGDLNYQLEELQEDFSTKKARYKRREFLFQEGAISKEDYEEYKNLYKSSEARLKQKELEKKELEIRAPFHGIVTATYAVPGAFVTPTTSGSSSNNGSSTSSSIIELSEGLEVVAKVPESDIGRIKIGQDASIRVDAFPDQRFKAKVRDISPRAIKNNNVISFEVTLILVNPHPEKLRIGMTTDIEFQTGSTSLMTLVPTVAIVTEKGIPGVLIVGKKNEPQFQKVELGISSGSKTAIINGVNSGESVFINLPPWSKNARN